MFRPTLPLETLRLVPRAFSAADYDEGDGLNVAVVPREVGRVVGDVSLFWRSQEHRQGELGFVFHPDFHGLGVRL